MIQLKVITWSMVSLLALLIGATTSNASETPAAKVNFVSGDVFYKPGRYLAWRDMKHGGSIPEGSQVRLPKGGKGRMELALNDGSVVRMVAPGEMQVKHVSRNRGIGVRLNLLLGRLWSKVRKIRHKRDFEIHTATAVLGVRGTAYDTVVGNDQAVDVRVFEGSVAAEGKGQNKQANKKATPVRRSLAPKEIAGPKEVSLSEWLVVLESMQHLRISAKGVPSEPVAMDLNEEKKQEWIRWNLERDKALDAKSASALMH
ncbi:MAG: FecR family protein [Mariprofundaceae bacterium]